MADRQFCVYLLATRKNGTLYIGVTNDFARRVHEHRTGAVEGFTSRHKVTRLVWYEVHDTVSAAITREKQLKEWKRAWKVQLVEHANPQWRDLYSDLM